MTPLRLHFGPSPQAVAITKADAAQIRRRQRGAVAADTDYPLVTRPERVLKSVREPLAKSVPLLVRRINSNKREAGFTHNSQSMLQQHVGYLFVRTRTAPRSKGFGLRFMRCCVCKQENGGIGRCVLQNRFNLVYLQRRI